MPFYVKSYGISTRLIGRKLQKLLLSMDLQKKKNSSVTTWRDRSQLGETGIRGVAAWQANLRHIFREEEPISSCYGQIHIEIPPRLRESGEDEGPTGMDDQETMEQQRTTDLESGNVCICGKVCKNLQIHMGKMGCSPNQSLIRRTGQPGEMEEEVVQDENHSDHSLHG